MPEQEKPRPDTPPPAPAETHRDGWTERYVWNPEAEGQEKRDGTFTSNCHFTFGRRDD